jgi:hypothetical protein
MKSILCLLFYLLSLNPVCFSQAKKEDIEDIYTDVVLYPKREAFKKDLRDRVIGKTFASLLDSNSEYKYESACWAITQFIYTNETVEKGFNRLFSQYDGLEPDTKKSFLEAVYGTYPQSFRSEVKQVLDKEKDPRCFCICAAYLFRKDPSIDNSNYLKIKMTERFPGYDSMAILVELQKFIDGHSSQMLEKTPSIVQLFRQQESVGQKTIYSFQRWNRDFPGLALVQNANGSFAKDSAGNLLLIEQLARSGSDLPYFISNGSTPQGIYSIQGLDVAHNHMIGPTPNIQLLLPFEDKWNKFFHQPFDPGEDSLRRYLQLLPADWRNYAPMMEAWFAGKVGRTEIIAHGTTIDPDYFKGKPFYPLTPTLGCLCAKEIWNPTSGRLLVSEQFKLVQAFESTPGNKGFLYVINVDNQQKAVSRNEVEDWVKEYQSGGKR